MRGHLCDSTAFLYYNSHGCRQVTGCEFTFFHVTVVTMTTPIYDQNLHRSSAISYRCSIATKSVFPAVFDIFCSKSPVLCICTGLGHVISCIAHARDLTLCKIFVHILIFHPTLPIHYDIFITLEITIYNKVHGVVPRTPFWLKAVEMEFYYSSLKCITIHNVSNRIFINFLESQTWTAVH